MIIMNYKVLSITEKVPQVTVLPDGYYIGTWGGYTIIVEYANKTYELKTEEGVRGTEFKVVVEIKNGVATFNELN